VDVAERSVAAELALLRRAFDESFAAPRRETATASAERFLVVRVAGEALAVRLDGIAGIERMPRVVGLPGAPAEVRGVAGVRGRLLPVYDLAAVLGAPRAADPQWLLLAAGDEPLGVAVAGLEGQVEAAAAERLEGASRPRPHVTGYVRAGGEARGVIDLRLLAADIQRRAAPGGPGEEP
jgi:purine-binding chemotaxis protein CheW